MPLFFSGKAITIDAEDYYDAKWTALDGFYQYVDEGDDYELAIVFSWKNKKRRSVNSFRTDGSTLNTGAQNRSALFETVLPQV